MDGEWNWRRTPRRARRTPALLRLPDGATAACVLRDRSATGAAILFDGALPAESRLEVPGDRPRRITVRWRCGARIGVMFLPDET